MRIAHLSDLHIGKRVNDYSMIDDQKYILDQIVAHLVSEEVETVIIAGDVYDKSTPSAEAVELFGSFLTRLSKTGFKVFIISGNHDSSERLSFASELMVSSNVYIAPTYSGVVSPVVLEDDFGPINFYSLPFVKPVNVRQYFPDSEINSYTDAIACAVGQMNINSTERNILVAHQFVTGAETCESEEISIGGLDNVDSYVFDDFDYVALGHIHRPQRIGRDTVRYSGTPLKYSFSEINHKKSISIIDIKAKGDVSVAQIPLTPLHDMRVIKDSYDELTLKSNYENTRVDDYLKVILTDEDDIPNVMNKLRLIYPNIMKLEYDNTRTRTSVSEKQLRSIENKSEFDIFSEFFSSRNGREMSADQTILASKIFEELKERNT